MSPLVKYYLSNAGALGGLLGGSLLAALGPKSVSGFGIGLIGFGILCLLVNQLLRCPRCGWRLGAAKSRGTHGLPGRTCPQCGFDLTRGSGAG